MVGAHGVSDALPYAVDDEEMVVVEIEIQGGGSEYIGPLGRLKRSSERLHNIGEGHSLVVDEQT